MSAFAFGKLGLGAAGATAVVALVAGCGSTSSSSVKSGVSSGLKTKSTSIGTVLVDASGHTVYELDGDSATSDTCTADCLAIWPAVRANGSQVIVNGHPAFTFTGDSSAGQTTGQDVTDQWGLWLALDANGDPIGAPAAASSNAPVAPTPAPITKPPAATTKAPSGGGAAF